MPACIVAFVRSVDVHCLSFDWRLGQSALTALLDSGLCAGLRSCRSCPRRDDGRHPRFVLPSDSH